MEPDNATKSSKARGSNLRVHFKTTRETAQAIKKMPLRRAQRYLKNVISNKELVTLRRLNGTVCMKSHVKALSGLTQGRWP
uniref:Large ribosomal subunit protein uL22 n=1 Tax=Parasteatoda tepidariorum TaxID=114398 RepID=A0A2L2YU63_PARTP